MKYKKPYCYKKHFNHKSKWCLTMCRYRIDCGGVKNINKVVKEQKTIVEQEKTRGQAIMERVKLRKKFEEEKEKQNFKEMDKICHQIDDLNIKYNLK